MATKGWSGTDPSAWADTGEKLLTALLRNSVQALALEASKTIPNGGRVPVKTGNLGRSVVVDTQPPKRGDADQVYSAADFTLGVSKIKPGDTIYLGWQAAYAARQNFGFVGQDSLGRTYNSSGYGFAEATAAEWPTILAREAAKLRGR